LPGGEGAGVPESYVSGMAAKRCNILCFLRKFPGQACRKKELCNKKGRDMPCGLSGNEEKPGNVAFPAVFPCYQRALPVSEVEISGIAV
jgi:hypothetical protein